MHAFRIARAIALLIAALTASVGAAAGPAAQAPDAEGAIVFENVRVLPMTGAEPLERQSVAVEDGRIVYVGPATGPVPAAARVIDGAGRTLLPGLRDMHVHYESPEDGALYIANGITTVRQMSGQERHIRFDALAKSGDLVGPHVYSSGPLMDGPEALFGDAAVRVATPEEARGAVEARAAAGFRAVKLYEMLDAETFRAAVRAARERGMQVWAHTPVGLTLDDMLELDVDSIEHLDAYQFALMDEVPYLNEIPPAARLDFGWPLIDESRLDDLAERIAAAGVWTVPTLTVRTQSWEHAADAETFFARPELRYVNPDYLELWRGAGYLSRGLDNARRGREPREKLVMALYQAGAGLLAGTDAPNPYIVPGYSIHEELENLARAGIPNAGLLRIATSQAARFLGEEGEFGIVAEGARADLILVDGDPLTDLSTLRSPDYVMINGRLLDRAQIQSALEAAESHWREDRYGP